MCWVFHRIVAQFLFAAVPVAEAQAGLLEQVPVRDAVAAGAGRAGGGGGGGFFFGGVVVWASKPIVPNSIIPTASLPLKIRDNNINSPFSRLELWFVIVHNATEYP
jgi:hypothetical protein